MTFEKVSCSQFQVIAQKIGLRFPDLNLDGITHHNKELDRFLLHQGRNYFGFNTCALFLSAFKPHWTVPITSDDLLRAIRRSTQEKDITEGVVILAAIHLQCRVTVDSTVSGRPLCTIDPSSMV
ncbi:MAG: hypothetical protein V4735_02110 [Pseudomonadota bacterium]